MSNVINLQAKNNVVNLNHAAIEQHQGDALKLAVEAGEYLLNLRKGVEYGDWQKKLDADGVTVPANVCDLYMKAANGFQSLKSVQTIEAAAAAGAVPPLVKAKTPNAARMRAARAKKKAAEPPKEGWNAGVARRLEVTPASNNVPKWLSDHKAEIVEATGADLGKKKLPADELDVLARQVEDWLVSSGHADTKTAQKKANAARASLAQSAKEKFDAAVRKAKRALDATFQDALVEAKEKLRAENEKVLAEQRERFDKRAAEIREAEARIDKRLRGLDEWITMEEYKLIRGCLHPDREATAARKAKAFHAFCKLEDAINMAAMQDVEHRRRKGWYGWLKRDKR